MLSSKVRESQRISESKIHTKPVISQSLMPVLLLLLMLSFLLQNFTFVIPS